MTSILRDQNRVPVWFGLSSVDGVSLVKINVNPSNGRAKMDIGTTVSAVIARLPLNAQRDDNFLPVLTGQSSVDSQIIPISVNPTTGAILATTL